MFPVDLGPDVRAWFTGRPEESIEPALGRAGNLSHRRPHEPGRLAADRAEAFGRHGVVPRNVHLLEQVHGNDVAEVTAEVAPGTELRAVDAAVTRVPGRALVVLTADCVPVLLAGDQVVAVAHAGRRGLLGGIVEHTLARFGSAPQAAAIGPAIGPCCYEVPPSMAEQAERDLPGIVAETTWGTPSLDLPGTVARLLAAAGVPVTRVGGCTACTSGWFSHRKDPDTGRQAGVIVAGVAA